MKIYIEDLRFECIIGLLDFERNNAQSVILTCKIDYNYTKKDFINYADVVEDIKNCMIEKKFKLLETAIEELSKILKESYPNIQKLYIKITKPDILTDAVVGVSQKYEYQT